MIGESPLSRSSCTPTLLILLGFDCVSCPPEVGVGWGWHPGCHCPSVRK